MLFVLASLGSIRINQLYVAFHPEGSSQIIYNILPGDREGSSTAKGIFKRKATLVLNFKRVCEGAGILRHSFLYPIPNNAPATLCI